jgi:hypothetical protein
MIGTRMTGMRHSMRGSGLVVGRVSSSLQETTRDLELIEQVMD